MGREVSESCVDSLLTEMVSTYCNRFYANKPELAAPRIEAIGYQKGEEKDDFRKKSGSFRYSTRTLLETNESRHVEAFNNSIYTMERPRFSDHLEARKSICKDFWSQIFKKQIDNLKTNHRGTFVLQDNRFRWLSRISIDTSIENAESQDSSPPAESKAAQATSAHLYFPCGIIRGALSNLGIPCAVSADISNLPAYLKYGCNFFFLTAARRCRRLYILK